MKSDWITAREASVVYGYHPTWYMAVGNLRLVRKVKLKPTTFYRPALEKFLSEIGEEDLRKIRAYLKAKKTPSPAGTPHVVGRGAKITPGGEAED